MAYQFAIDLPGEPSPEVLAALIEGAAVSNTQWYLEQWRQGKDPPCCAGCAGILWEPDQHDVRSLVVALPHALTHASLSCHSAAAMAVGHERAVEIRKGCPWDLAMQRHRVELRATGPRQWHALMRTPNGLEDVTAEMEKAP